MVANSQRSGSSIACRVRLGAAIVTYTTITPAHAAVSTAASPKSLPSTLSGTKTQPFPRSLLIGTSVPGLVPENVLATPLVRDLLSGHASVACGRIPPMNRMAAISAAPDPRDESSDAGLV